MANTIIMSKYQGLGNDYLILDPKKNQVQLQGKKIALLCQRGLLFDDYPIVSEE